jgi:hypothetical protein
MQIPHSESRRPCNDFNAATCENLDIACLFHGQARASAEKSFLMLDFITLYRTLHSGPCTQLLSKCLYALSQLPKVSLCILCSVCACCSPSAAYKRNRVGILHFFISCRPPPVSSRCLLPGWTFLWEPLGFTSSGLF